LSEKIVGNKGLSKMTTTITANELRDIRKYINYLSHS
jgi:hypothetical protein